MSHRYLTDPSLSALNHTSNSSNNPAILLNQYGPSRPTDPVELRQLVLDYLCHQCFVDTASAFAKESASNTNRQSSTETTTASTQTQQPTSSSKLPSATQSVHPTPAVKDTVIERTVRFDTDDDGDAEMSNLIDSSHHHHHHPAQSNPIQASNDNPEGSSSPTSPANPFSNPSRNPINLDDKDDCSSLQLSSTDHDQSYPDWTSQDIQTTRLRLVIKEHIINGRIKEAIKLIESHFPAVLGYCTMSKSPSNSFPGTSSTDPPKSKASNKSARFKSSRSSLTSRPLSGPLSTSTPSHNGLKSINLSSDSPSQAHYHSTGDSLKAAESNLPSTAQPAPSFTISSQHHQFPHAIYGSLNPAHVALNLQIQFFVEFVRSISQMHTHNSNGLEHEGENHLPHIVPESSHANGKMSENAARKLGGSSPNSHSGGTSNGMMNDLSNSVGGLSDDTSTTSSSVSTRTTSLALSLPHCRALHDFVHQLPEPIERAIFAKELENVAGLLAYVDPWDSPVRKYLDQSRRDLLAERVNAAILVHLGRSPTSVLQLVAQQACFTWSKLGELGERIPCPTSEEKSRTKPIHFFNLREFVDLHDLGSPH